MGDQIYLTETTNLQAVPELSTPPGRGKSSGRPKEWFRLLEGCGDGRWYWVRDFSTAGAAYNAVYRRRNEALPPGRWEFTSGPHGDKFGVWARNLDGPFVGADDLK